MPADVVFSRRALDDLDAIWSFLSIECDNTSAADKIVKDILDDLDRLSTLPELGTPLNSRCIVHSEYRFVVSGNYLSFYLFEKGRVYIVRVLDGRSEYLRTLFDTPESAIDLYT